MTPKQFDIIKHHLGSTFEIDHDDIVAALQVALNKAGIEVKDPVLREWRLIQDDGKISGYLPTDFDAAIAMAEYIQAHTLVSSGKQIDEIRCFENGELVAKYDPVDGSRRWQKGEPTE